MRRWHAARLTEPAEAYRLRHPHPHRRVLARQTRRDGRPEPPPILSPRHPRPPRRPQLTPQGPIRAPLTCHRNILPRCCDDRLNPPYHCLSVSGADLYALSGVPAVGGRPLLASLLLQEERRSYASTDDDAATIGPEWGSAERSPVLAGRGEAIAARGPLPLAEYLTLGLGNA